MNIESVTEFLGGVPLLQRLPSLSFKKIAQLLKVKYYDRGQLVIGERESEGGVYFVWEGEAEVCEHEEEEIRPEFLLTRYDYFGFGSQKSEEHAKVVAASKLTCLLLPHDHCALLWPKSMRSLDGRHTASPLVEQIMHLDLIEVNVFQGITLPDAPKFQKIYGGQFIGQALAAASKTVDCPKIVHHLQGYFLLVGDYNIPIIYKVHCQHDGKSFASRRVDAIQNEKVVFTLLASFQMEYSGFEFDHQETVMPSVPPPDSLLSIEELRERRIIDPRFPRKYRNKLVMSKYDPWPVEIRFCDPSIYTSWTKKPASLRFWFRAKGNLPFDQALHRSVVAYISDFIFLHVSANPHRLRDLKIHGVSLNHSMWFHRPVKADDWLLVVIESSSAHGGRGFCSGQMYNTNGEFVVSLFQEGVLRAAARTPNPDIRAKY